VIAGIGQGYWVVTPLQLAHAVAMLANRGVPHTPRLLLAVQDGVDAPVKPLPPPRAGKDVIHDPAEWKVVLHGMINVINGGPGVTARGLGQGFPYVIAGKTGTAERYSRTTNAYESHADLEALAKRHRALFIAFTPAEAPRIAVAVIVEEGAWGGSTAAPIARAILDAWAREQAAPAAAASTEVAP
jgi:penicillin-binding protein 2